jgi:hypothetical protein
MSEVYDMLTTLAKGYKPIQEVIIQEWNNQNYKSKIKNWKSKNLK